LFAWLEQGAHFYVCGDANRMAKMWIKPLKVVETGGDRVLNKPPIYSELKAEKRYQRDVIKDVVTDAGIRR